MGDNKIQLLEEIPYCLIHISKYSNIKKIYSSKEFIPSVHNPKNGKIQWLGNGVYCWDQNDYTSRKIGVGLARGKFFKSKICGICVSIQINDKNYLNLEENIWANKYNEFLKKFQPDNYQKICDYLEMIKQQKKPDSNILNLLGEIVGTTLNLFIKVLQEEYGYQIDMVSAYFYHERRDNVLLQRSEKIIQQFCVRNLEILNKSIENCKIVHIN